MLKFILVLLVLEIVVFDVVDLFSTGAKTSFLE